ncbi:MAG: FAD-binding protein [Chloroflexi bacterium]|nr:FAD-binding protein [Chloroflexota bacterium]
MCAESYKLVDADVLVVGGGAAGCLAALAAGQQGSRVVLVEKAGSISRSGNLASGIDHFQAILGEAPWDTPDEYLAGLAASNDGLIDLKVAAVYAREVGACVRYLEEIGFPFRDPATGKYRRVAGLGGKHPRSINFEGGAVKQVLAREVNRLSVKVVESVAVSDLLTQGERVVGALGFHVRKRDFYVFRAQAVVMATGGVVRYYPTPCGLPYLTHHSPYNTGDGHAAAYRAGASFCNMEFTYCSVVPKDFSAPGITGFVGLGGKITNALGDRYMTKYHPWGENAPRNAIVNGTLTEIRAGRGPCYVDCRHLSPQDIELVKIGIANERPTLLDYLAMRGIDPARDPIEFEPQELEVGVTFANGAGSGLVIQEDCATTLAGLYAAGDCANVSFAASGAGTLGFRAGAQAATFASKAPRANLDETQVREHMDRVIAPFGRQGEVTPGEFEAKLRKVMQDYVGFVRNRKGLETALGALGRLREHSRRLGATDGHELMRASEAISLLQVAELTARAALTREESRAVPAHFRADFPERDEKWRGFIVLKKQGDATSVAFEALD